ncbi:MAG: radical SAM protein [Theionarchaea archaeon]|nr:radical SAM protein [Theionarchaea archaeon]
MKPSYYNVFFPFKDQYILFNTLHGSIFVVDAEMKNLLESSKVSSLDDEYIKVFEEHGIIVDENLNEQDTYKVMYERSKYNTITTSLHVITTYNCNLACIYCYEGKGELEHKSMDEKTAHCAIKFIKNLTENENSKSLGIELFGGEPFLNMPINLLIAKKLHTWCEENNKYFSVNAITNGTLSSAQNVEALAEYGCSYLVTVDGPKEIHDQRRIYKNGKGTFDDIMEGLHRVNDEDLRIMIRINVDEKNKGNIVSLFEYLKEEGLEKAMISIKPVFNTSPACLSYSYCMPDVQGLKTVNNLYSIARSMGFKTEDPEKPSPLGACSAQQITYFTIDPYLRLFKCAILPPYEKNAVGAVSMEDSTPLFNNTNTDFLSRDPLALDECRTCKLVPVCRGGCPAEVFEIQGTTHGYVCRKPGLYETLRENLISFVQ